MIKRPVGCTICSTPTSSRFGSTASNRSSVDSLSQVTNGRFGSTSSIYPDESFAFPPEMTYVQDPIQYANGFEDISKLPAVRAEMVRRGWRTDEIDKVMGENWMRVYAASIG